MTAPARAPQPSGVRSGAHRRPILIGLMMSMALSAVDTTIVSTAIPQVVRDLGGFTLFSWVFSSYLLTQTVTIPIYGKLADQWGRKPILIAGTIIFLAGSALCASSWSMLSLICFRGLQGLGAGSINATVNTLAGDLYALEERGRVQGWLSSVWGISAVFGPALGGSLAQYASWRWIFLINLPVGAVAIALIVRYLHEQVRRTRHRIDAAGALAVLLAAGALMFGLLQGGVAWPWWSAPSIAVFAVAAAAAAGVVIAERRAAEPILPPWLWRRRVLAGSALAATGLGLLVIGPTTFLPTYGQLVIGLGAVAAGAVLATMSFGWPLATSQSARLFLRLGFRDTALIGAGICLAAVAGFLLLPVRAQVWQLVADTFVLGAGLGLLSVCTVVGPQSTVGWDQRGVVTGTVMFCRYLGQSLGAAIFGAIFNASLAARLRAAPGPLRAHLPSTVSGVSATIGRTASLGPALGYLRSAISAATHDVYAGLSVAALATIAIILIIPRRMAPAAPDPPAGEH
ncbi:MAG TPA: MFS transporter [Streptosporangiaceae bacterium]|nr:MFS transporter [Streptosporangiaceae bacterium]